MGRKKKWMQWYDYLSPAEEGKRKKRVKKNDSQKE
jgi:hypothetical protein